MSQLKLSSISQFWSVYQNKISIVLTVILLAISAWMLAQIFWLVQQPVTTPQAWKPSVIGSNTTSQSTLDVEAIQRANLFGQYQADAKPVAQPVVTEAPKTRLNLILVGAVASSNSERSLAVISNRGTQSTYGVGERIEGTRATLKAVLIDRVIIENSGRDETLMLEGIEYKKLAVPEPTTANAGGSRFGNNPRTGEEKLERIRSEITENPQTIFQYVRLSQVKRDGEIIGYRVNPGKDAELFDAVGLKRGDIATQLNGQDLSDPEAMGAIFQSISDITELNLTVERDGQSHQVYIEL
nr:type II secretion system protein GspC [Vibrio maerlii]